MTEEQEPTIRVNDSIRAGNLIDRGVIDAQEERERIARDPESGYQGIDVTKEIPLPDEAELGANLGRATDSALGIDADFVESEHPRDEEGKFSSSSESRNIEWKNSKGIPMKVVVKRDTIVPTHHDDWGGEITGSPSTLFTYEAYGNGEKYGGIATHEAVHGIPGAVSKVGNVLLTPENHERVSSALREMQQHPAYQYQLKVEERARKLHDEMEKSRKLLAKTMFED
jgi:hypothetical protein